MTSTKRLSFILPMYNVEPYLDRCIRSLENQDIPQNDFEVICINDGSPDNSREVVINLKNEFNNIHLIDQVNMGVSVARNRGIEKAEGLYLFMVDPDDFLVPMTLKERLAIMDQYNLDIGAVGFMILNKNQEEEYRFDPKIKDRTVMNGIDYINRIRRNTSEKEERDPGRSWAFIFRTRFIKSNNLRYLPDVPYLEDSNFMAKAYCLAEKILFLNGPIYQRTTRPGSATHSKLYYSEKARTGFLKAAYDLLDFQRFTCRNDMQKNFLNSYIIHFVIVYLNSHLDWQLLINYPTITRNLKKGPLKTLNIKGCTKLYKRMAAYYNRSILLFYLNWLLFKTRKGIEIRTSLLLRKSS